MPTKRATSAADRDVARFTISVDILVTGRVGRREIWSFGGAIREDDSNMVSK